MAVASGRTEKIKIFSWWDFISPVVVEKFKKNKVEIAITEYRSNEVALSKLLGKDTNFDVVIVSNWVARILEENQAIDTSSLSDIVNKRKYFSFIKNANRHFSCIPYLWAATAYAVDIKESNDKLMNLNRLGELKRNGFKIGIIDDPMEFGILALLSYDEGCAKNFSGNKLFRGVEHCRFPTSDNISKLFKPADFRNSIKPLMAKKTALYGWSGEIGEVIENYSFMDFVESTHMPVLGFDAVCILKKKSNHSKIIKFVEELTGKEMTKINAEKMQYFSAYADLEINYNPKIKRLKGKILERVAKEDPIFLVPPSAADQKKLNQWWQKIRYGQN